MIWFGGTMKLFLFATAILIFFFICIVNYHFQKIKYKYATNEQMKKLTVIEHPNTWMISAFISGVLLLVALIYAIGNVSGGFGNLENTRDTINQYQNDSTSGQSK